MHNPRPPIPDQELMSIQKLGIDAANFLEHNEFYTRHLKPGLDTLREQAKKDGDWNPSKTTDPASVALFNAYNSGKREGLNGIEAICRRHINAGTEATKELERRQKAAKNKPPQKNTI